MATITFKSVEKAKEAVRKFNGAPIDGGRSRLRLNMIIDPTKKPLASRIQPLQRKAEGPVKGANLKGPNKKVVAAKKQKKEVKKRVKPEKKSLEQLDQEMADYFEEKKE